MPNSKLNNYKEFTNVINKFKSEDLKQKLIIYFRGELEKYGRDDLCNRYTNKFCRNLEDLNNLDIEFYLEYCLDYFEVDFEQFLSIITFICRDVNRVLKDIDINYLRYSGKGEIEKLSQTIGNIDFNIHREWSAKYDDLLDQELIVSIKNIIEIERKQIQDFYNTNRTLQKNKK